MRTLRKLIDELRLISAPVYFACLVYIVAAAAVFAIFRDSTTPMGSLAPNLFAGSIDALFTVILINYIITRTARREHRPMRFAAFLQAVSALHILQLTWFDMIKASSLDMPPEGADLLDAKYFDTVAEHLDLDQIWMAPTTWLSRATAGGMQAKEIVGRITARYTPALSPDMILRCTAFENSGLVSTLAGLFTVNMPFAAKGTTMQKPFTLSYAKESAGEVRQFVAMVHEMAMEFEGEEGYRAPDSFFVTAEMAQGEGSAAKLASARIE